MDKQLFCKNQKWRKKFFLLDNICVFNEYCVALHFE